ncbi:helix-turn-helix transcriptional regulator [Leifsonia sp. 21MFCrub1.1]|uniref:helix-turn-helix transcriptional regulator n=1 Tax=Leifsonia sp. 21MFCrub1.1 TaxID=1798223 RepID=UPI0012FDED86|nr:helix-turn-helix transcriptional regulator [Leifsonia sp. 21MFCrub1.1]
MPRPPRPNPNAGAEDTWPDQQLDDPVHETARQFVLKVRDAMASSSIRSTATLAGIDHNTLRHVLAGESWPDLIVISRLERALGTRLWPETVERSSRRKPPARQRPEPSAGGARA